MTGVILLNEKQLAMGTIIEAVGRAGGHRPLRSSSAPQLADDAVVSCLAHADRTADELEDVDLLVAHGSVPAFPGRLAERLGIGHDRVAAVTKSLDRAHTAAPALAIEPFVRGDELSDGNVLFVSVGAGNSVAAATYQHR